MASLLFKKIHLSEMIDFNQKNFVIIKKIT